MLSKLPLTTPTEFDAAVAAAKAAFPAWRDTPVPTRARVMLKLQQLIRENWVGSAGRAPAPLCSAALCGAACATCTACAACAALPCFICFALA